MSIQPEDFLIYPRWRMVLSADLQTAKQDLAAEVLAQSGQVQLRVYGNSMVPALWPGEKVRIERIERLAPGMVVLCRRDDRMFLHRLVRIENTANGIRVFTRGDGLLSEDPAWEQESLLGSVSAVWRDGIWMGVGLELSFRQRMLAALVRRSGLGLRLLLRWRRIKPAFERASASARGWTSWEPAE